MRYVIILIVFMFGFLEMDAQLLRRRVKPAVAAGIAYDNAGSYTGTTLSSPATVSATIGSVSNQCLFVGITWYYTTVTVDSLKVDGTGGGLLTLVNTQVALNGNVTVSLYRRVGVQAGSRSVSVYFHGGTIDALGSSYISLSGVNQTTPTDTAVIGRALSTTATVNITTPTNDWIVDATGNYAGATGTAGTNQTKRAEAVIATDIICTMGTKSAAGTTQSYSLSTTASWVMSAVQVKPQ